MRHYLVKDRLDALYDRYNSRHWVHPDPLEFLYRYPALEDREVAGLIASSLAYGRVSHILKSVAHILEPLGASPAAFLRSASIDYLSESYAGFKHRFSTGREVALLLAGAGRVIERYGSLSACFLKYYKESDETVLPALASFVGELYTAFEGRPTSLLSLPQKGSACKRSNLFLRWMVRKDEVDPGGWVKVSPSKLVVPLDTHMHRIAMQLGLTTRHCATMKTALEITRAFRDMEPNDPVRYDFALTRIGMRGGSLSF